MRNIQKDGAGPWPSGTRQSNFETGKKLKPDKASEQKGYLQVSCKE